MEYCNQCGAKLEPQAVFCRECGRKLMRETPRSPLAKEKRAPKLLYILPLWILVAGVVMYFIYNMNRYVTDVRNGAPHISPMLLTVKIGQAALVGILPAALHQLYVVRAGKRTHIRIGIAACAVLLLQCTGAVLMASENDAFYSSSVSLWVDYLVPGSSAVTAMEWTIKNLKFAPTLDSWLHIFSTLNELAFCLSTAAVAVCSFVAGARVGSDKTAVSADNGASAWPQNGAPMYAQKPYADVNPYAAASQGRGEMQYGATASPWMQESAPQYMNPPAAPPVYENAAQPYSPPAEAYETTPLPTENPVMPDRYAPPADARNGIRKPPVTAYTEVLDEQKQPPERPWQ